MHIIQFWLTNDEGHLMFISVNVVTAPAFAEDHLNLKSNFAAFSFAASAKYLPWNASWSYQWKCALKRSLHKIGF